ncbi:MULTISPECIES: dihydrofolate reductase family protein [unclassified Microbacterium]|uniref:dihydrofolate reductase family protein n=1 Tax=unclassified Microbacterium TaxID=2609290 RepID=UPI003863CB2E
MWVTEVLPSSGERADAGTPEGRRWLAERYHRSESAYVRLNMIASLTGAAAGADGTSDTLTNRVDRAILGAIRADADVVLVGAQSVRAEGYLVPRHARLAIASASGDLAGHRLTLDPDGPEDQVLLLLPDSATAPGLAYGMTAVSVPGGERMTPASIVAALCRRGLPRIVCEGGPSLASQFAEAGLIDEYCVTSAPALTPVASAFLDLTRPVDTDAAGMLVDESGFSYLRLRRS